MFKKKSVIRLPDNGFLRILFESLCHYQARAFGANDQKEKQQGYKYPYCLDNDDNVVDSFHYNFTIDFKEIIKLFYMKNS